jgi:peptide/nickel transport system permease protein
MTRHRALWAGGVMVALVLAVALFAPLLAPYDPDDPRRSVVLASQLAAPSSAHPFGNDENGGDVLSRVVYGARVAVRVGVATVAISLFIGLALGCLAGYAGGAIDGALMRATEVVMAFPGILLAIAIIAATRRPSEAAVILALVSTGWASYARLARGQVLSLKERDYVTAARALGASPFFIVRRHIIPNLIQPLVIQASFSVAGSILAEASLSFLGLGPEGSHSWGVLLDQGTQWFVLAPHLAVFPGLAIAFVVLAFNLLGDGLRDYLDPRL